MKYVYLLLAIIGFLVGIALIVAINVYLAETFGLTGVIVDLVMLAATLFFLMKPDIE